MKSWVGFVSVLLSGALSFNVMAQEPPAVVSKPMMLTREASNEYALLAMMASNAYASDADKIKFPIEKLGWKKVDEAGHEVRPGKNSYRVKTPIGSVFSNLEFDIWEDSQSKRTVIAFKGTKEKIDWLSGNLAVGISIPYKSAKKHVRLYKEAHPDRMVTLTGHSLGGGLALSSSLWLGVDAVVFNTSPRVFDGLGNHSEQARRLAVFQHGEVLNVVRSRYPKFLVVMPPEQLVETLFQYPGGTSHRSDLLAAGLLACATDPALKALATEVTSSVPCYLP